MNRPMIATLWAGVLVMAPECLACSGPGAETRMEDAERLGRLSVGAAVVAIVVGLLLRPKFPKRSAAACAVVLTVHPAFWVSARGGDCGAEMLALCAVLDLYLIVWAIWPRIVVPAGLR